MPDGDPKLPDSDLSRWFDTSPGMWPVRGGNKVIGLVDGAVTFAHIATAIRTANASGHFVYLLGWRLDDSFQLLAADPDSSMLDLLTTAAQGGAEVRAMLWDFPGPTINAAPVKHINKIKLPGGSRANTSAILDDRTLKFGSHHQKLLVVYGTQGLVAFLGGIDIHPNRINPDGKGMPHHDVHCRIEGPAAWDVLQVFSERWFDHPDRSSLQPLTVRGLGAKVTLPTPPLAIPGATCFVQIGRTYPDGTKHAGFGPPGYTFAPTTGLYQVAAMHLKAIATARSFIYIEDQYVVDTAPNAALLDVRAALVTALPKLKHVTILTAHHEVCDLPQASYRRGLLIGALRRANRTKVRAFYLTPPGGPHTSVHSKAWVFDDQFAIIGSANLNRRGWTHDSEVAAAIWDQGQEDGTLLWMPHRLRMRQLWGEHLGLIYGALGVDMPLTMAMVAEGLKAGDPVFLILKDGAKSRQYWLAPPVGSSPRIAEFNYRSFARTPVGLRHVVPWLGNPGLLPSLTAAAEWGAFIDPDGS
ncbi:phosphatidylserine/phosphatidylglycerophosphate/cardiolipin synthase family protein [Candidatus Berkelbacteria bacterium]|nr:phosphatidylserine/phosphatidylglycerophosphate/cardiolipin synthase family protein [Candidatus Berkelbacteria bacterium]